MKDYILGVDLGGTNIKAAAYRLESYEKVGDDWGKITAQMVSDACDAGDATARAVVEETGELLGFGLVNVINLFNPQAIVVGGGMSAAGERLLGPARRVVESHALAISRAGCEIVTAQLGDAAGMLGAAVYGARRMGEGARM